MSVTYTKLPAILLLADGTVYHGKAAGKIGTTTGEICFNTGMTGYQEIFTDPSYFGQIMVATNAHIGNYGVNDEDGLPRGTNACGSDRYTTRHKHRTTQALENNNTEFGRCWQ